MPAHERKFTVHGLPAPQGSKRHVGKGVMVESSKYVKPWREAVKAETAELFEPHERSERTQGFQARVVPQVEVWA